MVATALASTVPRTRNQVGEAVVEAVAVVVPAEALQDPAEQVVGPHRQEQRRVLGEARGQPVEERRPGRPHLIPR